jgi:hypothetical protein
MALTIEDGSLVTGANSYVTAAEWDTWATDRGLTHTHSTSKIEEGILRAMDYFESLEFLGQKHEDTQSLQWPRDYVYIDGYSVNSDIIPSEVKAAVYEAVKMELDGDSPIKAQGRETQSEKIGDISVTYKSHAGMRKTTPAFTHSIRKLVQAKNAVYRA